MARTTQLAAVLWMSTAGWLSACGRWWFDTSNGAPDAPTTDASMTDSQVDAPVDATTDAPDDVAAAPAPQLVAPPKLTMDTACGNTPQPASLVVTNSGNADLMITNASLTGDPFQVKSMPVLIAPGATGTFSIEPPMAVIGTDLGGSLKQATLKIESNAGTTMVDLEAKIMGANLVLTPPSPLDFTSSSGACPASKLFSVTNTGNLPILVTPAVQAPFGFDFSLPSDPMLQPGASVVIDVRPVTNQCAGAGNIGFTVASGATLCKADPLVLVELDIQGSTVCQCS